MQTRDQKYALDAYDNVSKIKETQEQKTARKYGVICHKLPILIHTAGLAQALAFVESRKDDQKNEGSQEGKKDKGKQEERQGIYKTLLNNLGGTIGEKDIATRARTAQLGDYIRLTTQVMETLVWYKRFAQSILGVDASDKDEEVQ